MLELDPALLDQDKIRHTKRKKLLLFFMLPIIIFAVFAIFFLQTGISNLFIFAGTNSNNYSIAKVAIQLQSTVNLIEPYLPYYNRGYIELIEATDASGLSAAEESFKESLKYNPPESLLCPIYVNMSYAIELEADLYVEKEDYSEALVLYNRAESTLYNNNCASRDNDGAGQDKKAEEAKKRISKKRNDAVNKANGVKKGDDDNQNGDPASEQEIDEETLEKLKQSQEDAEQAAGKLRYNHAFNNGAKYKSSYEPRF